MSVSVEGTSTDDRPDATAAQSPLKAPATPRGGAGPGTVPSHGALLRFFTPLGLTSFLITVTHSIINGWLTQFPHPEASLAAYSVAKSVMQMVQNPSNMVRQLVVSLITDQHAYKVVRQAVGLLVLGMAAGLALLGFTPLGPWTVTQVMGLDGEAATQGLRAIQVFVAFPLAAAARNFYQGTAILARATGYVPVATCARLGSLVALLAFFAKYGQIPGAVVGALSFTVTMGVEAFVLWFAGRSAEQRLRQTPLPANAQPLRLSGVFRFFLPLMGTTVINALTQPLVQAGLARSSDPTVQIAAFAVSWTMAFLLVSPAYMLHQCSLVFTSHGDALSYRRVRQFSLTMGLALTAVLAALSYTGFGERMLLSGLGITPAMHDPAVACLRGLVLFPLATAWREYCWGILMRKRLTGRIGSAKLLNIGTVVAVMIVGLIAGIEPVAGLGAWSLVIGEGLEGLLLFRLVRREVSSESATQSSSEALS